MLMIVTVCLEHKLHTPRAQQWPLSAWSLRFSLCYDAEFPVRDVLRARSFLRRSGSFPAS